MGGNCNDLDSLPFPGVCEIVAGEPVPLSNNPMDAADVWAFEHWHGQYYFGGQINPFQGSRNIVAFDGVGQWSPMAQGVGGNHVNCITGYGDSLFVGGYFLPGPNVQSPHIQLWDGSTWHPFFANELVYSGQVFHMEVYEGALWILGTFQFLSGGPTYAILRYDGHELCAIGGPEYDTGSGSAMAFFQGYLYKGMGAEYPGLEFEHIARLPLEGLVPDECHEVATGVRERNGEGHISLYPNPAADELTITGLNVADGTILDVLDVLGRSVMKSERITSPSKVLDLAGLPAGCYQLQLSAGLGAVVKRFVKR